MTVTFGVGKVVDENLAPTYNLSIDQESIGLKRILGLSKQSWLVILSVAFVLTGLGVTSFLVSQMPSPSSSSKGASALGYQLGTGVEKQAGADTASVTANVPAGVYGIPGKSPSDPRISFLLLGYGGAGHDGPYLTDSMMLAVADPNQKTLTLLSIPRDIWAPMLFDGKTAVYNKLNTAFAFAKDASLYRNRLARYSGDRGAGYFVEDTVARLLGIPITNYFGLDFDGFRQMIDTVGGIDVDVPASFTAQYPANDDSDIDSSWTTVRFRKGEEQMNGERALEFSRAREVLDNVNEGSDFARSRRQRIVMDAFKTRLLAPSGIIHMPQILAIAARHVDSDYPLTAAGQLSQFLLGWKDVRIYQAALTGANYLIDGNGPEGAYVLIPNNPDHSWNQVRAFARRLYQDPATGVAMADTPIVVENDTGVSGTAGRLSSALMKLGYRVSAPISGTERVASRLVDRTDGKAKPLVDQLQKDLGVSLQVITETETVNTNGGGLILQLGADNVTLADLSVPADDGAPTSSAGIEKFDGWAPYIEPTATEEPATATPAPVASPRSTAKPKGSPAVPAKGAPAGATPTRTAPATVTTPTKVATPSPRLPSASP